MYSFHVWAVLRETTTESDAGALKQKIDRLERLIESSVPDVVPGKRIHAVNVEHVLQFSVSHNHRGSVHDRLISVLVHVATELPGSYGVAYWHDDETPGPDTDAFRVIVMARGTVRNETDPFLSPLTPVVED